MYEYKAKALRVLDGDTAEFDISLGLFIHKIETLRFAGIDTPELNSSDPDVRERAKAAKEYVVAALLADPGVEIKLQTLKPYPTDKYGRFLSLVLYRKPGEVEGVWRNLCEELVQQNLAVKYDGGAR